MGERAAGGIWRELRLAGCVNRARAAETELALERRREVPVAAARVRATVDDAGGDRSSVCVEGHVSAARQRLVRDADNRGRQRVAACGATAVETGAVPRREAAVETRDVTDDRLATRQVASICFGASCVRTSRPRASSQTVKTPPAKINSAQSDPSFGPSKALQSNTRVAESELI